MSRADKVLAKLAEAAEGILEQDGVQTATVVGIKEPEYVDSFNIDVGQTFTIGPDPTLTSIPLANNPEAMASVEQISTVFDFTIEGA